MRTEYSPLKVRQDSRRGEEPAEDRQLLLGRRPQGALTAGECVTKWMTRVDGDEVDDSLRTKSIEEEVWRAVTAHGQECSCARV